MYHTDPEKIRSHRPVPWWMHNPQLALPFGEASASVEPDAAPTAPPRAQHPEAPASDAADAPCPDMLPHEVRETYISLFGLPALYAEASCPDAVSADADEHPLTDTDAPRAEVVA
ncbi:MAG: hypothetical protein PPP56_07220 [Longimonas sp.]|uniref:hypothetical protein n=1 Tax=Longimonas sp. TaxID=2039626 RepID=UPI00334664A0